MVPHKQAVHRVGHHCPQHGVKKGAGVELHVAVKHFDGEEGGSDGRAEDRREPCRHSDQNEQSPLPVRSVLEGPVEGGDPRGDEGRWPFPPGGTAGPDRDRGADHLQWRHPGPEVSPCPVKGFHGGIRPVTFGLGGKAVEDDSAQQSSQCGDQRDPPQPVHSDDLVEGAAFPRQHGGPIPRDAFEQKPLRHPEHPQEQLGAQRADHPEQHGVQEHPALSLRSIARPVHSLRSSPVTFSFHWFEGESFPAVRILCDRRD